MGGEKHAAPASLMWSAGSPPRWRGKAIGMHYCAGVHRITPALAGKRLVLVDLSLNTGDHPRVGGEKP